MSWRRGKREIRYIGRSTYKKAPICIGVLLEVFRQVLTIHPFRDDLEWGRGDTEEVDNISVFQTFPHHSLLIEGLRVWSGTVNGEVMASRVDLCSFHRTVPGVYSNDANA